MILLFLSIPFWAVEEVAEKAGPLKDKTIIETTNPYPDRDGEMAQDVRNSERAASEFVADHFPKALVIKAFNTIYFKHLKNQSFRKNGRRTIPYAGDYQSSLETVKELIEEIGFGPVYVGKLSESHPMDVNQELYNKDLTVKEAKEILNSKKSG